MNTLKTISLTLLLCISATQSMENDAIVLASSEELTMNGIAMPGDILKKILKHLYPNEVKVDDRWKVNTIAEITKEFRSVCKHWYHIANPVAIRQLLCWNPYDVAHIFNSNSAHHYHILSKHRAYRHQAFLASALRDQPDLIDLHAMIEKKYIRDVKIALENGANPNQKKITDTCEETLLLSAITLYRNAHSPDKCCMDIIELLLDHGADIYEDAGNGHSILKQLAMGPLVWLGIVLPPCFFLSSSFENGAITASTLSALYLLPPYERREIQLLWLVLKSKAKSLVCKPSSFLK